MYEVRFTSNDREANEDEESYFVTLDEAWAGYARMLAAKAGGAIALNAVILEGREEEDFHHFAFTGETIESATI